MAPMVRRPTPAKVAPAFPRARKKFAFCLMDVDGVLTDGRIWLLSRRDGTASEIKGFSAYDGAGLKLARAAGLRTGVITGRDSAAVTQRARECQIEFVYQGRATKLAAYEEILRATGASDAESPTSATIFRTFPCCSARASRSRWQMPRPR